MRPSQTILVLEDLGKSFPGPLHRKGIELSLNDGQTVLEVYQQWWLLMIDLGYLTLDSEGKNRLQQAFSEMVKVDVLDLNSAFADLLHLVRCKEIRGFKALCRKINSHLYNFIKEDIELLSHGDVYAAGRLVQLFSYTSRLTLRDIDLMQESLDDYLETESNIPGDFPETIVASLNTIVKRWLRSFDPTRIRFNHGPGQVADVKRASLEDKYKSLSSDDLLSYAFGTTWWTDYCRDVVPTRSNFDRVSRTVFVPKSYKTFRTISMEPATLQYLQQGVWGEIDRVVASSWFLRDRIGFHDQIRNQRLARRGSIERNYATIDLSAASDSVSHTLAKKIFRGTKLLRYIVTLRSRWTKLPDDRLVALKKFAPMGSALCFPIETIIFAAICQYVTKSYGVTGDYSVFGDDIIVPTQCAGMVVDVLTALGFKTNLSKSFIDPTCWFRESCGGEYVDGFDVTPMRVSRKYNSQQRLVQTVGLVQLANIAYHRGYRNLRSFFIRKLRSYGYKAVFGPRNLNGSSTTNYHLKNRWNQNLQRHEVLASALTTITEEGSDESLRLRHWLESTQDRSYVFEAFVSKIGRSTVELKDCWIAPNDDQLDQLVAARLLR